MYGSDDPRSKLKSGSAGSGAAPYGEPGRAMRFSAAEYVKFYDGPPQSSQENASTWYARGQNFVVAYTEASAPTSFKREKQVDEYALLIPERNVDVTITTPRESRRVSGHELEIVPPGDSVVPLNAAGKIGRVFSALSPALAPLA